MFAVPPDAPDRSPAVSIHHPFPLALGAVPTVLSPALLEAVMHAWRSHRAKHAPPSL